MHCWDDEESVLLLVLVGHGCNRGKKARSKAGSMHGETLHDGSLSEAMHGLKSAAFAAILASVQASGLGGYSHLECGN